MNACESRMYVAHICAEALPTSLLARTSPGSYAASRRVTPSGQPAPTMHPAARHDPVKVLQLTHPPPRTLARGQLVLVFLEKFVPGHFLFDDIGELNDEVHYLFLKT